MGDKQRRDWREHQAGSEALNWHIGKRVGLAMIQIAGILVLLGILFGDNIPIPGWGAAATISLPGAIIWLTSWLILQLKGEQP